MKSWTDHLRVQSRSRVGRWSWTLMKSWTIICGSRRDQEGGRWSWTLMKSWTIICGSRRDQEGGGAGLWWRVGQSFASPGEVKGREVELDSDEELDNHFLLVQARSGGGRWSWTLKRAQEQIKSREVELGSESWTTFCFNCSSAVALRTLSLWLFSATLF